MDCVMFEFDGLEVICYLRVNGICFENKMFIIVLIVNIFVDDKVVCKKVGMDLFVLKFVKNMVIE